MLTPDDYKNLLALISSPRLTLNGAEAQTVAMLQWKLQNALKPQEQSDTADGDDARSAE